MVPTSSSVSSSSTVGWSKRLGMVLTGYGSLRARYSVAKFMDFDDYRRNTSYGRVALVLLLTPGPCLVFSLVPLFAPLSDPSLGVFHDVGYPIFFMLTLGSITFGCNLQIRAAANVSHKHYTNVDAFVSSVLGAAHLLATTAVLERVWRFPVPFSWVTLFVPWLMCVLWGNILLLRGRLRDPTTIRGPVLSYLPSFFFQASQVIIYPAFSAVYEIASEWERVALTLLFPVIKHFVKRGLRWFTLHLEYFTEEVAVTGVEVCSSMYQAMIMQNTSSPIATAVVIGIDVIQGMASVKLFMDKRSDIPQRDLIETASAYLRLNEGAVDARELAQFASVKGVRRSAAIVPGASPLVAFTCAGGDIASMATTGSDKAAADSLHACYRSQMSDHHKLVVTQALETMVAAETILLVEYIEVMIPMANAIFLAVSSTLPSARFNPRLRSFYHNMAELESTLTSLLLYTFLQGLSVVAMNLVMWYRFRLSATHHLAFILERHSWSIQGKLISWCTAFLHFTAMHFGTLCIVVAPALFVDIDNKQNMQWIGVDFTFRFQFTLDDQSRG